MRHNRDMRGFAFRGRNKLVVVGDCADGVFDYVCDGSHDAHDGTFEGEREQTASFLDRGNFYAEHE